MVPFRRAPEHGNEICHAVFELNCLTERAARLLAKTAQGFGKFSIVSMARSPDLTRIGQLLPGT